LKVSIVKSGWQVVGCRPPAGERERRLAPTRNLQPATNNFQL